MFRVDASLGVPVFAQLVQQVVAAVADGTLAPGTKLPTVRALAGELGVAVNTVAKAYRQLEAEGHVVTDGRHGTSVPVRGPAASGDEVGAAVAVLVRAARARGLDLEATVGVLRRHW